jgi:hypothetical protein
MPDGGRVIVEHDGRRSKNEKSETMIRKFSFIFISVFLSGCASTTLRTSPTYEVYIPNVKRIVVMPPDVKVYKISAGGVPEEMDEWNEQAKSYIAEALNKNLAGRFKVEIKFIDEPWLKRQHNDLWRDQRALYNAVSHSALMHGYPGLYGFPDKQTTFDYTLGPDLKKLSGICGADAMLFVWGYDYETSAGRMWVEIFNAAILGVYSTHPSALTLGLVNGQTGDLEWFVTSPADTEYSFRNKKHLNTLVEWLTRNYIKKARLPPRDYPERPRFLGKVR